MIMCEDNKIKVLWVDDEPNDDFINEAFEYGLDLDNAVCVNDGIAKLNDTSFSYDAIILDGNCRISNDPNETPTLYALNEAITRLLKMRTDIPWFVYTAANYEGKEALKYMIQKRSYDEKLFYVKPVDRYVMYDNILKAVKEMPSYKVKQKYASVLSVYSTQDFIDLLSRFDKEELSKAGDVPNTVRKVLEWIMDKLNKMGVLPVLFNGTNLSECSVCLGTMNGFIPKYIQRSVHHCEEIANEGSHNKNSDTYRLIEEGKAPYLNMSLVVDLLNILHWIGTLPNDVEAMRKRSIASYTSDNRKILHFGKVKKSPAGYLVLDKFIVSAIDKSLKEGDLVARVKGSGRKDDKYIRLAFID